MNIQFDTASLGQTEAQAIAALLSTLFPASATVSAQMPLPFPLPFPEVVAAPPASFPQAPVETVQNPTEPEPIKRTRRTRAEMAAPAGPGSAAAGPVVVESNPTPADAAPAGPKVAGESAKTTVASPSASVTTGEVKPISANELRSLLNGYIAKHSMEDAIAKLRAFGCNRVTEALALEPAKLNELAASLNG